MRILLDTVALWWIASSDPQLSRPAMEIFVDRANEVAVSPVSLWEIIVKHQLGKLTLDRPIEEVLDELRRERTIRTLPVHESAVYRVRLLPNIHRDPFDRLLICQAQDEEMTILTPDAAIQQYPVKTIW